jgi:hypothetical protein
MAVKIHAKGDMSNLFVFEVHSTPVAEQGNCDTAHKGFVIMFLQLLAIPRPIKLQFLSESLNDYGDGL